ncbi:MAG: AMP-binding protein [Planctomycetes bacterium]|nr:AMP-binding protein [Planctomycetota bacterium]
MSKAPDAVLSSPVPFPAGAGPANLAELVFAPRPGEDPSSQVLLGHLGKTATDVSLADLRRGAVSLAGKLSALGIGPKDTVALIRLPRTSELPIALAAAALGARGNRTLLPMYLELDALGTWLETSDVRAVLWNVGEAAVGSREARLAADLAALLRERRVGAWCLHRDLAVLDPAPDPDPGLVASLRDGAGRETECVIFTTSGSSGRSKLVLYRQGAILASAASWQAAGLFDSARMGGRGMSLLLAHSMGLRAMWNAIWTRRPLCLVTPEWFEENPEGALGQMARMAPEHVLGGPAVYRTFLALSRFFPEAAKEALGSIRTVISSGAPWDEELAQAIEAATGLALHGAFGTTETMQVASTLAPGISPAARGTLGNPLPGVELGLVRDEGELHRLLVRSPFGCAGTLEPSGLVPAAQWFETGDLVRRTPGGLVHAGRAATDFVKDGFGVKIPYARVAGFYAGLADPVESIEFLPLREQPGVGAIVFVRGAAAGERVFDAEILALVERILYGRHAELRERVEEFEFRHLTIARFACVGGPAPRTAKGTLRRDAVADVADTVRTPYVEAAGVVSLDRTRFA